MKLSNKTFWKIGGGCESFFEFNTESDVCNYLSTESSSPVVIGNGTNTLFCSSGFNGPIIKLGQDFDFINVINSTEVEIGAATYVPKLVRKLSNKGLGGIEHCVGIPATFGGLVVMNGGSQRRSISENLISVKIVDCDGVIKVLSKEECNFSYRESIFKHENFIILSARVKLKKINIGENRRVLLNILKERKNKFPIKFPSCGSVFLSSPELFNMVGPPGYVIESLGLKGYKIGNAQISEQHANFIVNLGGASSDDVLSLVSLINEKCKDKYGFELESEALFYSNNMKGVPLNKAVEIKGKQSKCEIF
ncbi:UDP-N-acetylmuramate dehydrogenase [Vibrio alginolyticus]|uniref:UDP-N-acetylmuramate dehydrogenase n=1 Tax=Vibrio alginolyticus TaxID=663 RepID=UPI001BD2121A|nr:UDP-N-acetylmuramate dehydrogenase [Vibrio alginolyticus]MBT0067375.1 UDP-N-acetylmuramate dehydrogenase [Vibrio alginolyticus]